MPSSRRSGHRRVRLPSTRIPRFARVWLFVLGSRRRVFDRFGISGTHEHLPLRSTPGRQLGSQLGCVIASTSTRCRDVGYLPDGMAQDSEDPRVARSRMKALASARDLFSREGLDAVTHLRVAEASGLGRKTLYRHFPQPVDLLRATLSTAEFPRAPVTGDLQRDLRGHLESLRRALLDARSRASWPRSRSGPRRAPSSERPARTSCGRGPLRSTPSSRRP